jgi:hypothetical protein
VGLFVATGVASVLGAAVFGVVGLVVVLAAAAVSWRRRRRRARTCGAADLIGPKPVPDPRLRTGT